MQNNFNVIPTVIHRKKGDWLAISPLGYDLQIGVIAETKEKARVKFNDSLLEWSSILENNQEVICCPNAL